MKTQIKVDIRTPQAWVMLRSYLEHVHGPLIWYLNGSGKSDGSSIATFTFRSEDECESMKGFLGLIEDGFKVR